MAVAEATVHGGGVKLTSRHREEWIIELLIWPLVQKGEMPGCAGFHYNGHFTFVGQKV